MLSKSCGSTRNKSDTFRFNRRQRLRGVVAALQHNRAKSVGMALRKPANPV
jgi:hypothetical protein